MLSKTLLFKNSLIHWKAERFKEIPPYTRGIYILFREAGEHMNVVYVGVATAEGSGARSRITDHIRKKDFTHFSVYEVFENIAEQQIKELEGLFLQIYATDEHANVLNVVKSYSPLAQTKRADPTEWLVSAPAGDKSTLSGRKRKIAHKPKGSQPAPLE